MVDLAETRHPADAHDLDRPILLNTSRPSPLVVHADHAHRAAKSGLGVCQRSDCSLDSAMGGMEKLAKMRDP